MKVFHISSGYFNGGAAIACARLVEAQRSIGMDAQIITQESGSFPSYVKSTSNNKIEKKLALARLLTEKLRIKFIEKDSRKRFLFSLGNTGIRYSKLKEIEKADIIHLHWINIGFLSLKTLKKIFSLNIPIVWTMHDIWAFTGGCNVSLQCENFKNECGKCPYLKSPHSKDISNKIFRKKRELYHNKSITFIAPSNHHKNRAVQSKLLCDKNINVIPNTINVNTLLEITQEKARIKYKLPLNKKLILFGADKLHHTHKGMKYLLDALQYINNEEIEVVTFGTSIDESTFKSLKINNIGYIKDLMQLYALYKTADVFVAPSLEDSFGQTLVEASLMQVPLVAFNNTGISDIIEHKKNGYLAESKDIEDLANGIKWCLSNNANGSIGIYGKEKTIKYLNYKNVATAHKALYHKILNN